MKKIFVLTVLSLLVTTISSCNVFDWVDPNIDAFDRCKSMNDDGDYAGAIEACRDADPDSTNPDAQLELADASLGAIGVNLKSLSNVFLKQGTDTDTILGLAEHILSIGSATKDNTKQMKEYAQQAVDSMDKYGALLGHSIEEQQIAVFYAILSRLCQISLLMAYADIDSSSPDGKIERADICNPSQPDCDVSSASICVGVVCNGMNRADAGVVADDFVTMMQLLSLPPSLGGLPSNLNTTAVKDLVNILVNDPDSGTPTPIDLITAIYKPDAGRRMLLEIARP